MSAQVCPICNGRGSKKQEIYVGVCSRYAGQFHTSPVFSCPRCQGKGMVYNKKRRESFTSRYLLLVLCVISLIIYFFVL